VWLSLICLTLFIFVWYFESVFLYLLISVILTYVLTPLVNLLSNRVKIGNKPFPRSLATLIAILVLLGVFVAFFMLFVPVLIAQLEQIQSIDTNKLEATYKRPLENLENWLIHHSVVKEHRGFVMESLKRSLTNFLSATNISGVLTYVTSTAGELVVGMFAVLFMTFFLVKDDILFKGNLTELLPLHYRSAVDQAMLRTRSLLSRYFVGIILESMAIMVLEYIGLSIIGFENALVVAVFAGLINPIPYLGPIIAIVFGLFVGLTTNLDVLLTGNLTGLILKILGVFVSVHTVDVMVFQPLITSKSVYAHPLMVFVVIFMGARIAGPFGMFMAIPVFTILRVLYLELMEVYKSSRAEKKRLLSTPPSFE